jgi:cytochrome c oxidase assembly protein subunit 11
MTGTAPARPDARRNRMAVAACTGVVALMLAAAYAAVPLYTLFCRVTGYGGTTQRVAASPVGVIDREVTVRFDANVAPGLSWRFRPVSGPITVKAGEVATATFEAVNVSAAETVGTSTFNVTPEETGAYFDKLQCFCFTEQRLGPGERVEMPVTFFVDPKIDEDPDLKGVHTITLSYTFFPARRAGKPVATAQPPDGAAGRPKL